MICASLSTWVKSCPLTKTGGAAHKFARDWLLFRSGQANSGTEHRLTFSTAVVEMNSVVYMHISVLM